MKYSNSSPSNSNIDELIAPVFKLGYEHSDKDYAELKQAIQQEPLKSQWEIVNMAKQLAEDDDVYTLHAFAEDMDIYLQAQIKGDDK